MTNSIKHITRSLIGRIRDLRASFVRLSNTAQRHGAMIEFLDAVSATNVRGLGKIVAIDHPFFTFFHQLILLIVTLLRLLRPLI